ncbi:MAG: DUF4867 family protein [Spirochaetaceae bacterium]|nr:DUF4867 family protein [Spirochaetaceae bacterium]
MLKQLIALNHPEIEILSTDSDEIIPYGRIVEGIDFSDMCAQAISYSDREKTVYIRDLKTLRDCSSFLKVQNEIYRKEISLQTGLCYGMNNRMNGMEYHVGSEVIVAVTNLVLILGRKEEISHKSWDSSLAKYFYLAKGSALELFGGTLHLAPCRVSPLPFCSVIILPEGTNTPLDEETRSDDPLLFMNNKWLICHYDSPVAEKGGFIGITGKNIAIKTL